MPSNACEADSRSYVMNLPQRKERKSPMLFPLRCIRKWDILVEMCAEHS